MPVARQSRFHGISGRRHARRGGVFLPEVPRDWLCQTAGAVPPLGGSRVAAQGGAYQSACLRKKAGISKSSMPPEASASTFAAACVRLVRQTLGTAMEL